jgi:hypothetical protein
MGSGSAGYAGDPDLVGRTISMDGVQRTVIGVMPENFNFPFGGVKLWMPVQVESATANRGSLPSWIHIVSATQARPGPVVRVEASWRPQNLPCRRRSRRDT